MINHFGSLSGGHYTAVCRVPFGKGKEEWHAFNDENVSKLAPSAVMSPNAYILFYVRRE